MYSEVKELFNSDLDRKIMAYLALYLLFQLVYSLFFYFIIFDPLIRIASSLAAFHFEPYIYYLPVLVISIICVAIRVAIDCYIGWKWMKMNFALPKFLHWGLSYLVFLGAVGINIIWGILQDPYLYNFRDYPGNFFLLSGLDLGMAFRLLQVLVPFLLVSVGIMPPFGFFYSLTLVFLLFCIIMVFILPICLFYLGVKIAERSPPLNESSSKDL
ncbi:MAG: hypothetical protein ACFFCZ_06635 [Promethearchaeota archaeon]